MPTPIASAMALTTRQRVLLNTLSNLDTDFIGLPHWERPCSLRAFHKVLRRGFDLKDTARSLLRAQDFHGVEPYGTVRRHQAGHQGNKGQHCADANQRQRI